jgi:hypothetical protein
MAMDAFGGLARQMSGGMASEGESYFPPSGNKHQKDKLSGK